MCFYSCNRQVSTILMEKVTDTEIFKYESEVVVELRGVDTDGDFTVTSYQFSVNADGSTVQAKGAFEPRFKNDIKTALEDAGYVLDDS